MLLLLIGPAAILLDSCNVNKCDCPKVDSYFRIDQTYLTVLEPDPPGTSYKPVTDSGAVKISDYRLILSFRYDYYSTCYPLQSGFSLIQSALACDCNPPGYNGSPEKITGITVVTENDFNSVFKAGDTISALVNLDSKTIPEFVSYWNQSFYPGNQFNITFTQNPDAEQWHKFRITVSYSSQKLESQSVVFRLVP